MPDPKRETVEGWKAIADLWRVDERTARRWAAKHSGLVRKHALTGRVFGYRDALERFKTTQDEGEPLGLIEPGRRAAVSSLARSCPPPTKKSGKSAAA